MGYSIVKMDLHEDGKTVTLTFKTGGTKTVRIRDISKLKPEKALVETFEEAYLFPVLITEGSSKQTYYFLGSGQEAIKNGEIFRAIINGETIKL